MPGKKMRLLRKGKIFPGIRNDWYINKSSIKKAAEA
jgi:hypothetical protein